MPPMPDHDPARRRLLLGAIAAGAVAACGRERGPASREAVLGTAIGCGRAVIDGVTRHFVGMVDLDAADPRARLRLIEDIDFFGHGVIPHPRRPHIAVICEKHGAGCCEVDLRAGRVLRRISTRGGREFYGHGAFSQDGALFFATEAVVEDGSLRGVLTVRDGESYALLDEEVGTGGLAPHDCLMIDQGRTLLVTNGGGTIGDASHPPSVAFLDVASGRVGTRLAFEDATCNAGHLALAEDGTLVCVSAPRSGIEKERDGLPNPEWCGTLHIRRPGQDRMVAIDDPIAAKMRGETLSVAIHTPSGVVVATNPDADLVTVWDLHNGRLVQAWEGTFERPRGVALSLDGSQFVLTHGRDARLTLIDAATLRPQPAPDPAPTYITGSHSTILRL